LAGRLLVTGGSGFVGGHVLAAGLTAGWRVTNLDRAETAPIDSVEFGECDIAQEAETASVIAESHPDVIIHCAAIGDVDESERNSGLAWRVNVDGTANIARAAAHIGARLIFISTSTIFDGRTGRYTEDDPPSPINIYGRTKAAAEHAVCVLHPPSLIARISMAYGYPRTGGASFLTRVEEKLRAGQPTVQPSDEFRTPTDVLTLAEVLVELAGIDSAGVLHIGPRERISRHEFALKIARRLGADSALVVDRGGEAVARRAPRPRDVSFNTDRAHEMLRTPILNPDEGLARVMTTETCT